MSHCIVFAWLSWDFILDLFTVHIIGSIIGWQQRRLTENSQEIVKEGQELYSRLAKFVDHLSNVGANLGRTVNSYNDAIGSLERRLLPSARRFQELQVTMETLPAPAKLDDPVRRIDTHGMAE
ncbi:MAG: DNA recombination protein RmuC [Caldilineaceae bacterium]|nr:DNA recombination protein RmuC [Caldilineaceae bacterium]